MSTDYIFLIAFSLGLMGSTHCIGMCGGIMGAISSAGGGASIDGRISAGYKWRQLFLYNLGRITTYSLIGLMLGTVSAWLAGFGANWGVIFRGIAGVTLILMGLYLAGSGTVMTLFESSGQLIWKYIQPLAGRFLPPKNGWQTVLLGGLWGWLPCGMVYSALIWASSQGDALMSATLMFCFGLGTMPALMLTGGLTAGFARLVSNTNLRKGLGVLVLLYGLWTLVGPMLMSHLSGHNHEKNHGEAIHEPANSSGHGSHSTHTH